MRFLLLVALGLAAGVAHAQWQRTPSVVVIGAEGDPRQPFVDEAISFWNKALEELGSGFRLGAVTRVAAPVPEEAKDYPYGMRDFDVADLDGNQLCFGMESKKG